jgi:N-methylhydantoinase A/oxoprolinase/acetone carboxylase beta subunit
MRAPRFRLGDAMVVDVGGTSTDVGQLRRGFPREANSVVEIGQVRTLFRMPDLLSLGLGGGSVVSEPPLRVGPESVGYRLTDEALVFGGATLTATDAAVAAGVVKIGDPEKVAHVPRFGQGARRRARKLEDVIDRMKTEVASAADHGRRRRFLRPTGWRVSGYPGAARRPPTGAARSPNRSGETDQIIAR